MKKHFIKNLSFQNFKCFESIEVDNLKRVNIFGGKNNVGKTSLLEGIELFVSSNDCIELGYNIYNMLQRRQSSTDRQSRYFELDFMYRDSFKTTLFVNKKKIFIEYQENIATEIIEDISFEENRIIQYEPSLALTVGKEQRAFDIERFIRRPIMQRDKFDKNQSKINFISSTTTNEREIAVLYGNLVDLNKESFLNESLSIFDKNLVSLKQKATDSDVVLKVSLRDREFPVLLSSLGEGTNRYIAILCAIWASQDGYLFIDEIENGIHYTNYDKLWKIIFEASKMANCQVFVTSHSKECISSFNEQNKKDEGGYFELYKNEKTDKVISKYRDKEQLSYALENNGEIRGE